MLRAQLAELHFIAHQSNVLSIRQRGILCFDDAQQVAHLSVAMTEVQEKRGRVRVPGGRRLHEYANLYFHARNPMMYLRRDRHRELCVLSVDPSVVDIPETVIADANASGDWTGFWPSPDGLERVDYDLTYAENWTDPDRITYWRKKSAKCAEVLVPKRVPPEYVKAVYVSCDATRLNIQQLNLNWPIHIAAHLFFQG